MLDHRKTDLGPGTLNWNGTLYRTLLTTADSSGAMSIVESLSPAHSGPPRHIHHAEDEVFVIFSGEVLFWLEGEIFTRGPGGTVFVPRGREHTFRVIGDQPSRHLVILTPGGFEGFFADMAKGRCRIPEDMPTVLEAAKRHNLTFTGPPLDA
jgi:mannose-6-phosphate isomerase-like protein (cupin superfamily)